MVCLHTHTYIMSTRHEYKIDDPVIHISLNCKGIIRYIGPVTNTTTNNSTIYYGIELNKSNGKSNGTHNGVQYFTCKENHGIFVRSTQIRPDTSISVARAQSTMKQPSKMAAPTGQHNNSSMKTDSMTHGVTSSSKSVSNTIAAPRSTTIASRSTTASSIQRKASVPTIHSIEQSNAARKRVVAKDTPPLYDSNSSRSIGSTASNTSSTVKSSTPLTDSPYDIISPVSAPTTTNDHEELVTIGSDTRSQTPPISKPISTPPSSISDSTRQLSNMSLLSPHITDKSNALKQAQLNLSLMKTQHNTSIISPAAQTDSCNELQSKYEQSCMELTVLKQLITTQQNEIRELRSIESDRLTLQHTIESLQLDNELLTEQLDDSKHIIEQHELTMQNYELDIAVLKEQLQTAHDELSNRLTPDELDHIKILQQNKQLLTALQQLKDITVNDKEKYTHDINELTNENRRLHNIEIQHRSMHTQLESVQSINDQLQIQLDEFSTSESMIEYLTTQNHLLNEMCNKYQSDIANLQILLDACNDVEDQHTEYELLLHNELEQNDVKLNELNNIIQQQKLQLHSLQDTIQQYRSQATQYECNAVTQVKLNFDDVPDHTELQQSNRNLQQQLDQELYDNTVQSIQCSELIRTTQYTTQQYHYLLHYLPNEFIHDCMDNTIFNIFTCIDELKYRYYIIYDYNYQHTDTIQHIAVRLLLSLTSVDVLYRIEQFESYLYTADELQLNTVLQQLSSFQSVVQSIQQLYGVIDKKQYVAGIELYNDSNQILMECIQQLSDITPTTTVPDTLIHTLVGVGESYHDNQSIEHMVNNIDIDTLHVYSDTVFNELQAQIIHSVRNHTTVLHALVDRLSVMYTPNSKKSVTLTKLYRIIPSSVKWNTRAQATRNTLCNATQLTEQLLSTEYQLQQSTNKYNTIQVQYNELQLRHNVVNEKLKLLHSKQSIDYTSHNEFDRLKAQHTELTNKLQQANDDREHHMKENKALRKQLIKYKTQLVTSDTLTQPVVTPTTNTSSSNTGGNELLHHTITALRKQLQSIRSQQLMDNISTLPNLPYIYDQRQLHKNTVNHDRLLYIGDRITQLTQSLQSIKTGGSVVQIDRHDNQQLIQQSQHHKYNAVKLLRQVHVVKQQLDAIL